MKKINQKGGKRKIEKWKRRRYQECGINNGEGEPFPTDTLTSQSFARHGSVISLHSDLQAWMYADLQSLHV